MKNLIITSCAALLVAAACATEPLAPNITLQDFKLVGDLTNGQAAFVLTATARVENSKGGELELLSGPVALTEFSTNPKWHIRADQNRFSIVFARSGKFPLRIRFNAAVKQNDAWSSVEFRVAPGILQPLVLRGLSADTQFQFPGAARPEHTDEEFKTFLPADGAVKLAWKEARPEAEGKLFYATEMLSQISVSPGLMRQVALLDFKVMQGEMKRVTLLLRGTGEVTRVQGEQVLAWNIEPGATAGERHLVIQFNQPQKDQFTLQVHLQTPLGAFPQSADVMQLRPQSATRFAGYFRIVNEGAVRLEVAQASGLSQISPEQFPENEVTRAALRPGGSQRFVYRFSGADFGLRVQADQILPELAVSELLAYRLGENELAIDGEIELDIREAPLRELLLRVPKGYAIAHLSAGGLSDYFVREPEDQAEAELRLVFGQPVSGRQVIQLRLERNKALGEGAWSLPRVEVPKAKSVRGHIAVAADAGFRLTPERTQSLTEIATAFFPRKVPGIQSAFRLSDPAWQAALRVERLPQAVQADALHLFSIGEGIAYGSSVINYTVSGAPVSAFRIELSDEYFNVEFTGKDIRNWQKTESGYVVQLHTPVSGAYTLLATYERPFKAQGETLAFSGARPLDAQSEQGHTLIISAYQFQVKPVDVSPGLLALETGEVPAEYRLFFDAPILAAYRYGARPFNLKLALSPLAQGDSLSQVVDRAALTTRISKEGQVLTDVRYFVKNRGNPHLRLTLPPDTQLWSAAVNCAPVVPVTDAGANLIPLPAGNDPNSVLTVDLKLASRSKDAGRVAVSAPLVSAPVMLAEWKLQPDTGQRLAYLKGSLVPVGGVSDISGFAQLARSFTGDDGARARTALLIALALLAATLVLWRWASSKGVYRQTPRHLGGVLLGAVAFVLLIIAAGNLAVLVSDHGSPLPQEVSFLAPVQQAGTALTVEVANVPDKLSVWTYASLCWPVALALLVWGFGAVTELAWFKTLRWPLGWTLLAWAALRCPNGAPAFLGVIGAFLLLHVVIPVFRQLLHLPPQPQTTPPKVESGSAAASAATALLIAGFIWLGSGANAETFSGEQPGAASANDAVRVSDVHHRPSLHLTGRKPKHPAPISAPETKPAPPEPPPQVADSVSQEIRVEDKYAVGTARLRWHVEKGQRLPTLYEPAVLTGIKFPTNAMRLVRDADAPTLAQQLIAEKAGEFDVEIRYELQVTKRDAETGFTLPLPYGVINQLTVTVANLDVEVLSPQAVSAVSDPVGSNTTARLVLSPAASAWVGWKPRTRDLRREKPVFYAELAQLYVPAAGVIEAVHLVSIRPAQGELSELVLNVPPGATITDVSDPAKPDATTAKDKSGPARLVSLWRFDPDARKLRVTLNPAQSRPFALLVRSQLATGPLPFEQSVGLLTADNAAGQIGLLGIATGNEVQLDTVKADGFSSINLEDFPADLVPKLQAQVPDLTLRRAFRYAGGANAQASLRASAVEPDVRVDTQDTVSLGEDRTVLAANATVEITRAGIFKLRFVLPPSFDVESISGAALSHWTEARSDGARIITLHLNGKTLGQQQFAISLAGPGVKATNSWAVPQLTLREAGKQRGTLLLVPEQGLRLQVASSDGLTQLDPQKSGIKQKGVLAFRVLQTPRSLALNIERVDPWIQVTSLQHATVTEAQLKILANLQYQIENTGLKSFRVFIPTNAEGVRFQGEQVADFLPVSGTLTNGLQAWEIKLHRRVIGGYLLQASYQIAAGERAEEIALRGIEAGNVNLQRGFVTIQSSGRLQVRIDGPPEALQPAEWQSIPRALQQGLPASTASFSYRLVEPGFTLPMRLERHDAVKLLAARVNKVTFTSVISDDGIMLTEAQMEMIPGDKRLLNLTLPRDAHFWFAFVNQNGVWPWREQDQILIPLEQTDRGDKPIVLELYYSAKIGGANPRALDLQLLAPKFDLPLENLTWRVSLSDKWQLKKWAGSMQLQQVELVSHSTAADLENYLAGEQSRQRQQTKQAEDLLAAGNSALQQGNPQLARRAFQAAFGLSTHDAAFNEDARVQLHNIKLQQALIGLNVRQAATAGEGSAVGGKLRDLRNRKEMNYTQQDAKDIIERNSADDNAAFMRLAERLIQQQDAAVTSPAALRASIPEQGRLLTFRRAVVVDPWADLRLELKATAVHAAPWVARVGLLAVTLIVLGLFAWAATRIRTPAA